MKKILIVEDDAKVAQALSVRMQSAGYQTDVAPDAIQGVHRASQFAPDLVLLDINLPAGNGIDVAQRLRRILPASTPIVFLTASKQPGLIDRAMAIGSPMSFLEKPYHPQTLLETAGRYLGN